MAARPGGEEARRDPARRPRTGAPQGPLRVKLPLDSASVLATQVLAIALVLVSRGWWWLGMAVVVVTQSALAAHAQGATGWVCRHDLGGACRLAAERTGGAFDSTPLAARTLSSSGDRVPHEVWWWCLLGALFLFPCDLAARRLGGGRE